MDHPLQESLEWIVQGQLASGSYRSRSDVLHDLRSLLEHQERLEDVNPELPSIQVLFHEEITALHRIVEHFLLNDRPDE